MARIAAILVAAAAAFPAAAAAAPRATSGDHVSLRDAVAPVAQFRAVHEQRGLGLHAVRYRQVVGGLPVVDSETVLTRTHGAADLLVDGSRRIVRPPLPATLSRHQAVAIARGELRVSGLRAPVQATLAVHARSGVARTAWRVVLASSAPVATYDVIVDARTGTVLAARDLLRKGFTATGQATVFDTNPIVGRGSRTGLSDSSDADSAALTSALESVSLPNLDDGGTPCLKGRWVHATVPDADAPPKGEVCDGGGDFSTTRSDPAFEAAMAYFHVDRAQTYIRGSLGITDVLDSQVRVRANEIFTDGKGDPLPPSQQDNSFYDPSSGEISLGTGGVDDGEDGEVIVHEYGHAIQDDQVPNFGLSDEGGAMGEGFGDYLAAAIANTFTPSPTFDPCIAEWDELGFGNPAPVPCLRRVDADVTADDVGPGTSCDAEVHCAGEAWSGALWDIRAQIGAVATDRLVIQSHFSLTPTSGFHEGSLALIAADQGLYGGVHVSFLQSLLASRGLLDTESLDDAPASARVLSVPGSVPGSLDSSHDRHDVFALSLAVGQSIVVRLTSAVEELDLRLFHPGTTDLADSGGVVAAAETAGSNERLSFTATETGTYFLDVVAIAGAGAYSLEVLPDRDADLLADGEDNCPAVANSSQANRDADAFGDPCDPYPADPANDADGDRLPAGDDNCPLVTNRDQRDWDGDGRGDRCDRTARVRLGLVRATRGALVVRATVRPVHLNARSVRIAVHRRACLVCRFERVAIRRSVRKRSGGRLAFAFDATAGDYRLRARLVDRRVSRVDSRSLRVRIR